MVKKPSETKVKTKKLKKKVLEAGPHKSFRRTYREDYVREDKTPGIMYHVLKSFRMIFRNWTDE